MDPATIYAITVTLVGIGLPPKVNVEPLPPEWTMADCVKDHEEKLAGKPNTMARCISRDRPFEPALPRGTVWEVSISQGWGATRNDDLKTGAGISIYNLKKCEKRRSIYDGQWGRRYFCVESRYRPKTLCVPHLGICYTRPS